MPKDSKMEFELDLSDIKSTKEVLEEKPQEVKGPVEPTGYIVKTKKTEDGKVVPVDLAELSGEEFVEWASAVFPGQMIASNYESRSAKVRAINNIMKFHTDSFLSAKRSTDKDWLH